MEGKAGGARRLPPPVVLAPQRAGSVQKRVTLPYGEADGLFPIKNSGRGTLSPDHYVYNLSVLPGYVLLGKKLCHKIR